MSELKESPGKLGENEAEKSEGELSEGELSEEGEMSDEGELPESEPEEVEEVQKSPDSVDKDLSPSADKFDRFKVWQEAMVNNMRSAYAKVGAKEGLKSSSSESSGSESEDENAAFMMQDSEIPPNLRSYDTGTQSNLLGALGVTHDADSEANKDVKRKKKKKKKGVPSEWWERHKEIYDRMKERQKEMDAHRARTHCKFFQKGFCKEGDECPFLHEIRKKLDVCKYFMKNLPCHKGENCPYMHNEYPCKYFHLRGFCYNDKECRFSHEALTDDTKQIIEYLKNDRFDRTPRFKRERYRSRSRSRSRSPLGDKDKSLFTDPDAPPSKKVLLPTPEEEKEREERELRDSDRHNGRSPRYDRDRDHYHGHRDNYRASPRGFFRGRGRGNRGFIKRGRGGYDRGFDRGFHRGGGYRGRGNFNNAPFNNSAHHPPPEFFEPPNLPNQHGPPDLTFMNDQMQCDPPINGPPPQFHTQDNFIPMQQMSEAPPPPVQLAKQYERPPPPPPPPQHAPLTAPTTDFGIVSSGPNNGVFAAEQTSTAKAAATVDAARDPRLKQNSEKQKTSQPPSLADMFKSLDPTASPFG